MTPIKQMIVDLPNHDRISTLRDPHHAPNSKPHPPFVSFEPVAVVAHAGGGWQFGRRRIPGGLSRPVDAGRGEGAARPKGFVRSPTISYRRGDFYGKVYEHNAQNS